MYKEEWEYFRYTTPQVLEKELHLLEGILNGIAIDNQINDSEIEAFVSWCSKHNMVRNKSPFNELIPLIEKSLEDGVIDDEERLDIQWLCNQFSADNSYYNSITADMQRLQGVLAGIVADGKISMDELKGLRLWLDNHENLKTIWPYDEIDSLITEIMSDGVIDEQEHHVLTNFCGEFLSSSTNMVLDLPIEGELLNRGICSSLPVINFTNKSFCLSGNFDHGAKNKVGGEISNAGGSLSKGVTKKLDYLVVGGKGSECWAFACYGRKVEQAMNYRKEGLPIQVIHEFDLMDALEDI